MFFRKFYDWHFFLILFNNNFVLHKIVYILCGMF